MNNSPFEYDVALSFATQDRELAEKFTRLLSDRDISVLHDEYTPSAAELWGKDMVDHLVNLYARKARYCVLLVSRHYPLQTWTEAERTSARERALRDANEYILPLRLDDVEVSGMADAPGYRDLRKASVESIVDWLEQKVRSARDQSGPPAQSHDLRSGNIPSTHND